MAEWRFRIEKYDEQTGIERFIVRLTEGDVVRTGSITQTFKLNEPYTEEDLREHLLSLGVTSADIDTEIDRARVEAPRGGSASG